MAVVEPDKLLTHMLPRRGASRRETVNLIPAPLFDPVRRRCWSPGTWDASAEVGRLGLALCTPRRLVARGRWDPSANRECSSRQLGRFMCRASDDEQSKIHAALLTPRMVATEVVGASARLRHHTCASTPAVECRIGGDTCICLPTQHREERVAKPRCEQVLEPSLRPVPSITLLSLEPSWLPRWRSTTAVLGRSDASFGRIAISATIFSALLGHAAIHNSKPQPPMSFTPQSQLDGHASRYVLKGGSIGTPRRASLAIALRGAIPLQPFSALLFRAMRPSAYVCC